MAGHVELSLVCKASSHHVCLLYLRPSKMHYIVEHVGVHYDVVFLNDSYSTYLMIVLLVLVIHDNVAIGMLLLLLLLLALGLVSIMILLSLYYVAAQHLRILNFDLRIIEDVVVVVNVFDDLDWLLLILLFGLR